MKTKIIDTDISKENKIPPTSSGLVIKFDKGPGKNFEWDEFKLIPTPFEFDSDEDDSIVLEQNPDQFEVSSDDIESDSLDEDFPDVTRGVIPLNPFCLDFGNASTGAATLMDDTIPVKSPVRPKINERPKHQTYLERGGKPRVVVYGNPVVIMTKRGTRLMDPKDKVECNLCGGVYGRSNITKHMRTSLHLQAFELCQRRLQGKRRKPRQRASPRLGQD